MMHQGWLWNAHLLTSGIQLPPRKCGFLRNGQQRWIPLATPDPTNHPHLFLAQLSTWMCPGCLLFCLQSPPPAPVLHHFRLLQQLQATKSLSSTLQQLPILEPSSSPSQVHHAPAPPQRRWWRQYPSHSKMQPLSYLQVTLQIWQTWPAALSHLCIQGEVLVPGCPFPPLLFTLLGVHITLARLCPVLQCHYHPKPPTWQ